MKKAILFLFIFFVSFNYGYPQLKKTNESDQIQKELIDSIVNLNKRLNYLEGTLTLSDSVLRSKINLLELSLDSTNRSIDDTRLSGSLKSAEQTISFQNSFIQIFGVICGIIAVFVGLFYFFSIRPLIKQADNALDRANTATDKLDNKITSFDKQVDNKINIRFESFTKKLQETEINEIFNDIESDLENQRRIQIERLTRGNIELTFDKIERLFNVLNYSTLPEYEKKTLIEVLIQINSFQIKNYFAIWKNVKKEEVSVIDLLYKYYINNGIENFLAPITNFILNRIDPHIEFNRLIDMLFSHPDSIMVLINSKSLIGSLEKPSRKSVIKYFEENVISRNIIEKEKFELSFLYQKD